MRLRLNWPWALHRDLAQRQQRTSELAEQVAGEEEVTARRLRENAGTLAELRKKGEENQFAQLIVDCLGGLLYRKPGTRAHGR